MEFACVLARQGSHSAPTPDTRVTTLTGLSAQAPPVLRQSAALGLEEETLQHHHLC